MMSNDDDSVVEAKTSRYEPLPIIDSGSSPSTPDMSLDTEMLTRRASEVVEDVKMRPAFYLQAAGVVGGVVVTITVLQAVVNAIEKIPVVPDVMELVRIGRNSSFLRSRSELF